MKVTKEIELRAFEFWGPATVIADLLTVTELDIIEREIEGWQSEWDETQINDLFRSDADLVVSLIGYEDEEEFLKKRGV